MYLDFYGLKEKPFQISSDPRFLWLGEKHKEALAILRYGVLDNRGFLLLTGDVGTGKTTLINSLVNSLGKEVMVAAVTDPGLEKLDFFNFIAKAFHITKSFASKGEFLYYLGRFLNQAYAQGKTVLLIIDEAQRLSQELLEEVRLLSNIEKQETKLINIFLVGQNEINDILSEPQNRALRQRITINFNIDPLDEKETAAYIRHRLKVAGSEKRIFSQEAVYEIFQFSGGFPRLINVICDHALLSGYVKEARIVSPGLIRECAQELRLPRKFRMGDDNEKRGDQADWKGEAPPPQALETKRSQAQEPVRRLATAQAVRQYDRRVVGYLLFLVVLLGVAGFLYEPRMFASVVQEVRQYWTTPSGDDEVHRDAGPQSSLPASTGMDNTPEARAILPDPDPETAAGDGPGGRIVLPDSAAVSGPGERIVRPDTAAVEGAGEQRSSAESAAVANGEGDRNKADSTVHPGNLPPQAHAAAPETEGRPKLPGKPVVIHFNYDSNDLTNGNYAKLDRLAEVMRLRPDVKAVIRGFTDSTGAYSYNVRLSEFRANVVKTYLIGKGVKSANLKAVGMGPQQPVRPNTTPAGRRANRRIVIEFTTGALDESA